ncbi:EscU/YscU/HrcU family type III secretion system export apparatus switch protein [Endozoicomonas sp. GU-1]|uniref:EscU/YscU/HrcU family type III secretion system export apparatus switch protein n=1 Tax=Endozoicomonas sp. GU-1 TaxID=3009078 RepID=UPI0022B5E3F9|nr:EscU/YscU/HrcU family type III secretion system export apparatus switch protein [Endozoicomonas sp. GU-1]WBA82514.1 EscU/YscU/HrcU family type III secretion system export apparatus switch protein [Endozoicomonas sp. GU-1]WBA85445.1 EscU/YscU/HrcU family type III secretion system export apparatus switch protein [Endozoicomonas sp. GU-1]
MNAEQQEQGSEPTEQPSERQKKKALQEGQVSRSRDLMIAMQTLAIFLLLGYSRYFDQIDTVIAMLAQVDAPLNDASHASIMDSLQTAFSVFPAVMITMFLVIVVSVTAGALISGSFIFSVTIVAAKARRINPVAGLKRICSVQGLAEVVRASLKALLLTVALFLIIRYRLPEIMALRNYPVPMAATRALTLLLSTGLALSGVLMVIAAGDVVWQKHRLQRQQLLTRQQVKDNLKNEDGSPQTRQRIRQTRQKMAAVTRRKMLDAIPDADLVLTNPGHFAVVLKYQPDSDRAPVLVARGIDHMAELIISIGRSAGKPVLIQPMLTRALYYHTDIDQEIAPDLYQAVAKIMVYLYQLDRYRTHQSTFCPSSPNIQIPEKYQHSSGTGNP